MGKILITIGILFVVLGVLFEVGTQIGFFRLPGDIQISGKNWKFYFPIITCLLVSAVLTLIVWVFRYFNR